MLADERFPIQEGPSVPWAFMVPHESQCQKNHAQSLKRIAERGGLAASEAWAVVNGLRYSEIKGEHGQKWFELAERVNREWSVKQARAEVLAACANKVETTIYYREVDVLEWDAARLQQQIANDIRQLQPAAKALEELLREARLEEARLRPHQDGCAALLTGAKKDDCDDWCGRNKRTAELDKARAGEGKG